MSNNANDRADNPSLPPPVPPIGLGYATPSSQAKIVSKPQKVFDTVAGPNMRLKDNLIQLICVVVGGVTGAVIGNAIGGPVAMAFGVVAGLLGALVLSGLVIGIIRFIGAVKK